MKIELQDYISKMIIGNELLKAKSNFISNTYLTSEFPETLNTEDVLNIKLHMFTEEFISKRDHSGRLRVNRYRPGMYPVCRPVYRPVCRLVLNGWFSHI